jgi:hypothetical protein
MHFNWQKGVHERVERLRFNAESHDDERMLTRIVKLLDEGKPFSITLHSYTAEDTTEELCQLFIPGATEI